MEKTVNDFFDKSVLVLDKMRILEEKNSPLLKGIMYVYKLQNKAYINLI